MLNKQEAIGRIRYKDLDGNGVIDELYDRTYIGSPTRFLGGITVDLAYKNFDLNFFFQGVYGNKVNNVWNRKAISGISPCHRPRTTRQGS